MHRVRAWGVSAVVAAALVALSLWRLPPPQTARAWALVAAVWAVGAVVLHLVLHNRWMTALDERWREGLARRRRAGAGRRDLQRGPGHATRRVAVPVPRKPAGAAPGSGARYDRRGRQVRRDPR